MQYEVRKSGGPTCDACGATELIKTARSSDELVHDITATIGSLQPSRWRIVARRRANHLARLHAETVEQLRKLTYLV